LSAVSQVTDNPWREHHTKYAEAVLAVKYRVRTPQGTLAGGPMYALERSLGLRWLAVLFAAFTAVAAFGIGCMVQANSISSLARETFRVSPWLTGALMTAFTAVVILGGIRSSAAVCERLVPFMAVFYVLGCVVRLALRADTLPDTLALIVRGACNGQAAVGGFLGAGMKEARRYGIARDPPLPARLGGGRDGRLGGVAAGRPGVRRHRQRPDGGAEPRLAAAAVGRHRGRDAGAPVGRAGRRRETGVVTAGYSPFRPRCLRRCPPLFDTAGSA
jgi:hypothetical protein